MNAEQNEDLPEKDKPSETSSILTRTSFTKNEGYPHRVEDPVWVFINDKPQRGVIRFIGRVPGGQDIMAGIEMVS